MCVNQQLLYLHTLRICLFQFAVLPVRMEEHADVHFCFFINVNVPKDTQDPPARKEVWTQPGTCMHVCVCMRACVCVCVCVFVCMCVVPVFAEAE